MKPNKRLPGWEWLLIVLILLVGWRLRVGQFTSAPPGIIHDEVRNWLNVQLINQGDIRALYPYGGGREAFYLFIQAASFRLIGDNLLAARFPSIAFSLIGATISFSLARRLFGRNAGWVAAAGWVTSFWALMFARLAVRTGSMPVMALITAYLVLRLLEEPDPPLWRYGVIGGLIGITLYTYPSALIFPFLLLAWFAYLTLIRRELLQGKWIKLGGSMLIAALMAIPLIIGWADPATAARADAVNAPLEALLVGDPGPTLANIVPVMGVFSVAGDHGLEFNIQDQPIFPTILMAIFFYLGLLWAIMGLFQSDEERRPGYALALIWLVGMLIPTLVTERPVNPSRTIGLLGIVYIFPAMAAARAWEIVREADRPRMGTVVTLIVISGLLLQLDHTASYYFTIWNDNPVVRFLYQDEYRVIASDFPGPDDPVTTAIGGLTPETMDPASLRLLVGHEIPDAQAGYFDPQSALLIPSQSSERYILIPNSISLHPALEQRLGEWGITLDQQNDWYTRYISTDDIPLESGFEPGFIPVSGADPLVRLIDVIPAGDIMPGVSVTVLTIWQADRPSDTPLRIFLHLIDLDGNILTQSDILGVPATQWCPGDVFIQAHDLTLPADAPPGPYAVNVGLYDPETNRRLIVEDPPGGDHLHLELP